MYIVTMDYEAFLFVQRVSSDEYFVHENTLQKLILLGSRDPVIILFTQKETWVFWKYFNNWNTLLKLL